MKDSGRKVLTVFKSGGDFQHDHVRAMQRQVAKWAPYASFECLSDQQIEGVNCTPLKENLPGWWSKIELFRPDIKGDFLYTDLDNVFTGPMDDFFEAKEFTLQRGGWTALMFLPDVAKRYQVWRDFIRYAAAYIQFYKQENRPSKPGTGNYGDAGFISDALGNQVQYWEDALPEQAINVIELRTPTPFGFRWNKPVPDTARAVLCGQPHRPWLMPMFQEMGLYD